MGTRFTRRRFLAAASASVTYLTLTSTVGCDLLERTPKVRPAPKTSPAPAGGVWSFRSRPDLGPPGVAVTTRTRGRAPGYIFIAPKLGLGQDGPMIVDDLGHPVWFRNGKYTLDFKVQNYQGKPVLTWWEGRQYPKPSVGEYVILDSSYREVARVQAGHGYKGNQHDFLITPKGTALITIYDPVPRDLSPLGGLDEAFALEGIIQEVDIESGEVLFEWHSLDDIDPDESYYSPEGRKFYDYFHLNSIDVDHDHNLLISARNTCAVYKVDRKSGDIIWRLGGKKSDFEMRPGTRTGFQHDARRQKDGTITIFDNGASPRVHEESRGITVELDEDDMTATLVRVLTSPDRLLATSQGNMQVLPNGNVFIGWGSAAHVSEFSPDGSLLFDAHLPPRDDSYRGFRFPWSAHPTDDPAVTVEQGPDGDLALYVSWNGATEVESWEVLAGSHQDRLKPLGTVPRDGFETALLARTTEPYVAVRAKESSGRVLGTSRPVESRR